MFKLINLNKTKTDLAVRITAPNGDYMDLYVGPMISKRSKDELVPDVQFSLMNAYLDYKGPEFKHMLYLALADGDAAVEETSFHKGLSNPPIVAIHRILDMFDMVDVEMFVKDVFNVVPPVNLKPVFDQQIETDGLGTRTQTYIQQDYYELVAITIPVKAVIGLLGQYALRKSTSISPVHKEYLLYRLISGHSIMNHPALAKIEAWASVLIRTTLQTGDAKAIAVIEKQVPADELPSYLLAIVVIQKLSVAAVVNDDHTRNVITRIYNYIINKLKPKGGSARIWDKIALADTDSSSGDNESIVEAYRIVSNLTVGTEVELNWYTGNMKLLIRDIGVTVNMGMLEDIHALTQCFRTIPITPEQLILAGYIFKDILDPRSLDYINIDGIINLISLGFVILWERGHKEIALLLNAKPIITNSDDIDINILPNTRLDADIKLALARHYPYEKQINKLKTVSVVETAITDLTYEIFKRKWLPNVPERCLTVMFGHNTPAKMLPEHLKNMLARMILDIENTDI